MFRALAHSTRQEVMALLRNGAKSSGELAEAFDIAWPTLSRHLSVLKDANLITAERLGTSIVYRANATVLEEAAARLFSLVGKTSDLRRKKSQSMRTVPGST